MTRPTRLNVVPLAVPVQLVLGWGLGLTVVGRKARKPRRSPGPIAMPARKAA